MDRKEERFNFNLESIKRVLCSMTDIEEINLIAEFIHSHLIAKMEGKDGSMLYSILVDSKEAYSIDNIIKELDKPWNKKGDK